MRGATSGRCATSGITGEGEKLLETLRADFLVLGEDRALHLDHLLARHLVGGERWRAIRAPDVEPCRGRAQSPSRAAESPAQCARPRPGSRATSTLRCSSRALRGSRPPPWRSRPPRRRGVRPAGSWRRTPAAVRASAATPAANGTTRSATSRSSPSSKSMQRVRTSARFGPRAAVVGRARGSMLASGRFPSYPGGPKPHVRLQGRSRRRRHDGRRDRPGDRRRRHPRRPQGHRPEVRRPRRSRRPAR